VLNLTAMGLTHKPLIFPRWCEAQPRTLYFYALINQWFKVGLHTRPVGGQNVRFQTFARMTMEEIFIPL
jgi:hypothetical protein